ncbi:MAG: hypothetical protein QNJ90_03800 [Planctomycetota bacterium]|nr:hypothetical protein [Planctomycetota bacterium]
MNNRKNKNRRQRGTVMVEYGLLLAAILVIGAAAVSILGHKTNDMIATAATILPGVHADDNAPIISGKIIETGPDADGNLAVDAQAIFDAAETGRLGNNTGIGADELELLVVEVGED